MAKPSYNAPMPARLPFYEIVSAKPGQVLRFVCLSRKLLSVETHWDGKFTQPHMDPESDCPNCRQNRPRRWKAYLAALGADSRTVSIVEITQQAVLHCAELRDQGRLLRGWAFSLRRKGSRCNGPVFVEPWSARVDSAALPPEFDLRPHLERMWGFVPELRVADYFHPQSEGGVA